MKTIQFVLSILVSICAAGMLYGAITTYSPMKIFSITIMSDTVTAVLQGEERKITAQVYIEPFYYAPILPEQKIGEVQFYLGEQRLDSWDLYPKRAVEEKIAEKESFWNQVKSWFGQ